MLREDCRVGMRITFGRANGQKTTAEVMKMNTARAKVRTLEGRGSRAGAGVLWNVPYSMMQPAGDNVPTPAQDAKEADLDDILENSVYQPDSGLIVALRAALGRLPADQIANLKLVVLLKAADAAVETSHLFQARGNLARLSTDHAPE